MTAPKLRHATIINTSDGKMDEISHLKNDYKMINKIKET
jgi:hypothetical protein